MEDKNYDYYEKLFSNQPDVLDTEIVRQLLGGISITTVWKMIRFGHLKHIHYRDQCFLVPKSWLIDYIMSDHYQNYKNKLRGQIREGGS